MHKYLVADSQKLTPTTLLITLQQEPGSKPFSFQPGQYAAISFKRHKRPTPSRCFSIVNSPTEQGILQFSMRSRGHFTSAMTKLTTGDEVTVQGPFGGFVFDAERHVDVVLLAGGIGITPFMSMIHFAAASHLTSSMTLLFSCQNQDDVPFVSELRALEKQNPHFKAVFIIGQGPTDKLAGLHVETGRITPALIEQVTDVTNTNIDFFMCGPPPFMNGMQKMLLNKGVQRARIITEAFSQGPNRQTGKIRSWPFNIYVLGAIGVVLGSFIVLVSDLLKTLPPSIILDKNSPIRSPSLSNTRQTDLDSLVNSLPDISNGAGPTNAVTVALQRANATASTPTQTPQPTIITRTISPSSNTPTPPPNTPTPPPAPPPSLAPTPVPTPPPPPPKCTTTQSGVTKCV